MSGRSRRRLVAAALVLVAGCGSGSSSPSATRSPTSPASASPSLPDGVTGFVQLDGDPYGIEAVGTALWVENGTEESGPALARIDPATRAVVARVPGARAPRRVGSELWYLRGQAELVRADPATGAARSRVTVPPTGHFAVDGGAIWLTVGEEQGELLRVDLASGKVRSRLALPAGEPKDVLVYEGVVWVAVDGANVVVQVDAATGRRRAAVAAGDRPHSLAAGFGSVWVTDHGESALRRIDARTGKVVATSTDAGINVAVTTTADAVWAASPTGLVQIRPESNTTGRSIVLPGTHDLYDVAEQGGSLWLTAVDERRVYEIAAS